ncbi:MAG: Ni/Fe hydrogenase subunit alpha [Bacteroidetes bacterium]|nr:Ni/Fe hydrogenase subunit alpha [Bacteroidota bacterium]
MKTISIDPVTRIEGHARISLYVDDNGHIKDAQFHVTQLRGFEKLSEGRPFTEMPSLMARICGICPVSHLMASAKACDNLLAVKVPRTGHQLRRVMNMGQIIQSHALSFFHLSSPDLLFGMDADPSLRNILGVAAHRPDLAKDGIRLRQIGQEMIELLGGKRIHPSWVVPGGVNAPLTKEHRDIMLAWVPEIVDITRRTIDWFRPMIGQFGEEIETFANFPTLFVGLVTENGELEYYDGKLRFMDAAGNIVADMVDPARYMDYIAEKSESYSYLKSAYYKPMGYPGGIYRVGPLARLNISDSTGTPMADEELKAFRSLQKGPVSSSFHYHYARLIEILNCAERIKEILSEPDILSPHVRAIANPNSFEGVGVSEAPRGTLFHHYRINENGLMTWANLIIATGNNNMAMNRGILQVSRHFIDGKEPTEGLLNRVEAVIRTFDPCLSCSTHAIGQMPMQIDVKQTDGTIIKTLKRG